MIKKILKFFYCVLGSATLLSAVLFAYFNLPVKTSQKDFKLGVTFSNRYSTEIGLDWKENFIAILDDLKVKKIRVPIYWDLVEKEEGLYDFSDVDWQLAEARKRDAEIILVVGQKVPRWPECFIPEWAANNESKRKSGLLKFIKAVAERYKNEPAVKYWQIENEPFLKFGICPPLDVNLLDQEVAMVKLIDGARPVILTDSGELSLWIRAAKRADIFGTTMYKDVCSAKFGCFAYPIGPNFFKFKHWIIKKFANQEKVIVVELQAEPWLDEWTINAGLEKQLMSMNAQKLRENIEFAKKTGFEEIYPWGVEWWYWLKVKKNYPDVWDEAKKIYSN